MGDEQIRAFAKAILHGDDEHREWLMEAAEAFIAQSPLPPPRGKGTNPPKEVSAFALHDRVKHLSLDLGTVTDHDGREITVTFDRVTPKGHPVIGIYDDNWFRIWPGTLSRVPSQE
jgi:hypothetical protein